MSLTGRLLRHSAWEGCCSSLLRCCAGTYALWRSGYCCVSCCAPDSLVSIR